MPVVWNPVLADQRTGRAEHSERSNSRILYLRVYNESPETVSLYAGMILGETVACNGLDGFSRLLDMEADGQPPPSRGCRPYASSGRGYRERYVPDMQQFVGDSSTQSPPLFAHSAELRSQPLVASDSTAAPIDLAAKPAEPSDSYIHVAGSATKDAAAGPSTAAPSVVDPDETAQTRLDRVLATIKMSPALNPHQQKQLRKIIVNHVDVFAENPLCPPAIPGIYHRIDTGSALPIYNKPYPCRRRSANGSSSYSIL